MKVILKDCVRYVPHEYKNEAELEKMVFEHYREIFGENALLFPKKKINSRAKIGTIPDAFVVDFGSKKWFVVEVELSGHPVYDHIVAQITKFITALRSPTSRKELANMVYDNIKCNPYRRAVLEANGIEKDRYKGILEVLEGDPEIVIIIDELTERVREAVELLSNSLNFKVSAIEFKTFKRKDSRELDDHLHLFNELMDQNKRSKNGKLKKKITAQPSRILKGRKLVLKMIEEGYLNPGFKLYRRHKGELYEAEVLEDGRIRLINSGETYTSLSKAAREITGHPTNGWQWWRYRDENGEHFIDDLRKKLGL